MTEFLIPTPTTISSTPLKPTASRPALTTATKIADSPDGGPLLFVRVWTAGPSPELRCPGQTPGNSRGALVNPRAVGAHSEGEFILKVPSPRTS